MGTNGGVLLPWSQKQQEMMKQNRKERVVEEVKLAIKPYYAKGKINKEQYKEIMRKAVPKVSAITLRI